MIRVKKTCDIDIKRLEDHIGRDSKFVSFQTMNNGNVAMVFEIPMEKENATRYAIKIHNRLGIQRQCSFTAIDSKLNNIILNGYELYAIMEEGEKITINRLEPETKEDLFPIEPGRISQVIGLAKESFMIAYEDGRVIEYFKGEPKVIRAAGSKAAISFDFNRRYMVQADGVVTRYDERGILEYTTECDASDGYILARGDRSFGMCIDGRFTEYAKEGGTFVKKDDIVDMDVKACSLVKDTAALYDGEAIRVYKLM